MPFTIPPINRSALQAFNDGASKISTLIQKVSEPTPQSGFVPELKIAKVFDRRDLFDATYFREDEDGLITEMALVVDDERIGLTEDGCKELLKLVEVVCKNEELGPYISQKTVRQILFEWAAITFWGKESQPFTTSLFAFLKERVRLQVIWIPIAGTIVQTPFELGSVQIGPITEAWFDGLYKVVGEGQQDDDAKAAMVDKLRRLQSRLQGSAAIVARVEAEPQRAQEVASDRAEESLAVLRMYSPGAMRPGVLSWVTPYGSHPRNEMLSFMFPSEQEFSMSEGFTIPVLPWVISASILKEFQGVGLGLLHHILVKPKRSQYEERLLKTVMIYSKCAFQSDPGDKLLYVLRALESFLFQSENEPIQQTVGDRVAYAIGAPGEARDAITKNFKKVYAMRSKLVHHGKSVDDLVALKEFYFNAWRFMVQIVLESTKFTTFDGYMQELNRRKWA